MWPIAKSEQFIESIHGSGEGHEASTPGVYASDSFEYGIGHYGWPANLLGDGMFYILQVWIHHPGRALHKAAREVYIVGFVVFPDVENSDAHQLLFLC